MRRYVSILAAFGVAALLWVAYLYTRLPAGVEAKGASDSILPWVTLAGSIVSLLTGIVGLWSKLREEKTSRKSSSER
jgi:hypothetical protein